MYTDTGAGAGLRSPTVPVISYVLTVPELFIK